MKKAIRAFPQVRHRPMIWTTIILIVAGLNIGWGDTLQEIRERSENIRTVRADFIQEKHLKILETPLISRGTFYFRMPDDLRWEYSEPIQSVLIMSNGVARRLLKTNDGWVEDDAAKMMGMGMAIEEITRWLKGEFDGSGDFSASIEQDGRIIIVPRQKALRKFIEKIAITVSETPGLLESVEIYESEDSLTRLVFYNAVANEDIDSALFEELK